VYENRNSHAVITGQGINFSFGQGELRKQILFDVELAIQPGEIVLLTGPSGSGKTTLLTLIAGLRKLQEGRLDVLGHSFTMRLRMICCNCVAKSVSFFRHTIFFPT
jgi:ABC-type sugar transport system ATPase subunit